LLFSKFVSRTKLKKASAESRKQLLKAKSLILNIRKIIAKNLNFS
jgi:hypothetical protein